MKKVLQNSMKALRCFYFPFPTLGSVAVLNILAHIPTTEPWSRVLEGAEQTLFSMNLYLSAVTCAGLPEGMTQGSLLYFINLKIS